MRNNSINLIGFKFANWVVISEVGSEKIMCECSCGTTSLLRRSYVLWFRRNKKSNRKCNHYEEIFPQDDRILGYVCGYIATDGCLIKNSKRITVTSKDLGSVITLDNLLVSNLSDKNRFFKRGKTHFYEFRATLPKLYQYCLDMGITPAKSLTLDVNLDDKSEEFKWAFLRGCIDGDGSVHVPKGEGWASKSKIYICGSSRVFLETLQVFFNGTIYKSNAHLKPQKVMGKLVSSSNPNYRLLFNSKSLRKLLRKLPVNDFTMRRKTLLIEKIKLLSFRSKDLIYKGIVGTLDELIELLGREKDIDAIRGRVASKWDIEDVFDIPIGVSRRGVYCYNGETTTLASLVRKYGSVSRKATKTRINCGMSLEEALLTPYRGHSEIS